MRLNTIKPHHKAKCSAKRVGRGIGSGHGKTCGRGHKGQHSRAGGYHKLGFEGGQMPLHRRVPKFGFKSAQAIKVTEVRLGELEKLSDDIVTLSVLKKHNIISPRIAAVKVIMSGKLTKVMTLKGMKVTAGARRAIEAIGGKIEA